jgi:hypothetical protein
MLPILTAIDRIRPGAPRSDRGRESGHVCFAIFRSRTPIRASRAVHADAHDIISFCDPAIVRLRHYGIVCRVRLIRGRSQRMPLDRVLKGAALPII